MKKGTFIFVVSILTITMFSCDKYTVEPTGFISLTNDSYEGMKNNEVRLDILANDDITGDVTVLLDKPAHGAITINNGSHVFNYQPKTNFIGTDIFEYEVCSANGECKKAEITVEIVDAPAGCNTMLTAVEDVIKMDVNSKIIFDINRLLANDLGCPGEISIDNFEITKHTIYGSLDRVGNYIYYTPATDYEGMDKFKYTIKSGTNKLEMSSIFVHFAVGVEPIISIPTEFEPDANFK